MATQEKVICIRVPDVDRQVKQYQDMGCAVKRHSKRGTFLDCTMSTFYDFETGRDELWSPGKAEEQKQPEADISWREYYC